MVRDYTREEYLEKIDYLRSLVPDISLSTDIIVGYPGETAEDFAETLSLLERVEYDSIYSFLYSERPNTPALKLKLKDNVSDEVKNDRLQAVQAVQRNIEARRLGRWVGRIVEVLVEGESQRGGQLCGRTRGNELVNFTAPPRAELSGFIGQLVLVRITGARAHTLAGDCLTDAPHRLPVVA
jgi:tRNA-2-methylthio-N6-dimethylallyladenosine synthase